MANGLMRPPAGPSIAATIPAIGKPRPMPDDNSALDQLRTLLTDGTWDLDARLPPERELAETLSVSRSDLRKALAVLEAEGQIWRHVGKGTFVGARPLAALSDLSALAARTSPAEVIRTRLLLEPTAARIAATNATPTHIAEMRTCLARTRAARTFQQYVMWDNRLHVVIGEATQNTLLIGFLEALHAIRRVVVWGRLREREPPRPDNPSLDDHDRIVEAIEDRNADAAYREMHAHLVRVEEAFMPKEYRR